MLKNIIINGIAMQEDSSLTILDVARKHGIDIPTLCFLKKDDCNFTHRPASCRVCVVEVKERRNLAPACATYLEEGMEILTNSYKVRQERKNIVELLLSNHPNACLTCRKSNSCELQALSSRLGISNRLEFAGPLSQENKEYRHGSILRNPSKCILCNRCTAICKEIQGIGAISASNRGFATVISDGHKCVNCGQCIQVCPTGALMQYEDASDIEKKLADPDTFCVVQTAPAVRVSIGEGFGLEPGTDVSKKMVTALRYMGFDRVFDTNFGADLTIMEEAHELVERIRHGGKLPMITSCCPGWVKFIETQYPDMLEHPSSCKSPQEMFSSICRTYYAQKYNIDPEKMVIVSLMPCTAKKKEITREQNMLDGTQPTDFSMTVKEFISMVKRYGLDISNLPDGEFDDPLGESTGAADIFAQTGGVMEAAIRTAGVWLDGDAPWGINWETGYDAGIKESTAVIGGIKLNLCIASGLANARKVMERVRSGEKDYHFIEIMACPGGCLNGGGQPIAKDGKYAETIAKRRAGIQAVDKSKSARISCDSKSIQTLYEEFLGAPGSELAHHLLHTSYADDSETI